MIDIEFVFFINLFYHVSWIIYLDELLDGLSLLELNLGDGGDGEQVLESVDNGVRSRGHSWVTNGQRQRSYISNTSHELLAKIFRLDVQDSWREDGAGIVDLYKKVMWVITNYDKYLF